MWGILFPIRSGRFSKLLIYGIIGCMPPSMVKI
jgi:hypothetical protein